MDIYFSGRFAGKKIMLHNQTSVLAMEKRWSLLIATFSGSYQSSYFAGHAGEEISW